MTTQDPILFSPAIDDALVGVRDASAFAWALPRQTASATRYTGEMLRQCYEVGIRTLPLVALTGLITGMVFTEQSRPSLEEFGATSWLPSLVTVALIRSLAPLVTALVCAGRVGSSIGAELGSMRVTEQIDAMEVSAVDPFSYLVVTRTVATTVMTPVLTLYFALIALVGSFVNVSANEGITLRAFVTSGFETVDLLDVGSALGRAVTFGFTIGAVACYSGFHATRGTAGVGRAANQAVVRAMLAIFLLEVVIVQILSLLRGVGP